MQIILPFCFKIIFYKNFVIAIYGSLYRYKIFIMHPFVSYFSELHNGYTICTSPYVRATWANIIKTLTIISGYPYAFYYELNIYFNL